MSGSVAVTIVTNCPLSASSDNQHEYEDCSNFGALSLTSSTIIQLCHNYTWFLNRKENNVNIEPVIQR